MLAVVLEATVAELFCWLLSDSPAVTVLAVPAGVAVEVPPAATPAAPAFTVLAARVMPLVAKSAPATEDTVLLSILMVVPLPPKLPVPPSTVALTKLFEVVAVKEEAASAV
ncbi:MAG: hypothetical protein POG74_09395, partial [Acidocella sp.]|nr:hypothetical protein [Acidocella sp.]